MLSYKELHLNKESTVSSINRLDDEIVLVFDENSSLELELVDIQKNLIEKYKPEKI